MFKYGVDDEGRWGIDDMVVRLTRRGYEVRITQNGDTFGCEVIKKNGLEDEVWASQLGCENLGEAVLYADTELSIREHKE